MNVCAVCEFGVQCKAHNLTWCVMGSAVLFILRSRLLCCRVWSEPEYNIFCLDLV